MPKVRVDPGCAGSPPGLQHMASGEPGPVKAGSPQGEGSAHWLLEVMRRRLADTLQRSQRQRAPVLREKGQEQDKQAPRSPVSSQKGLEPASQVLESGLAPQDRQTSCCKGTSRNAASDRPRLGLVEPGPLAASVGGLGTRRVGSQAQI